MTLVALVVGLCSTSAWAADSGPTYTWPQSPAQATRMHASYVKTKRLFAKVFTPQQIAVMEQQGLLRGDAGMSKSETPFVTSFRLGDKQGQAVATFRIHSFIRTDAGVYYPQKVKQADLMWAAGKQVVTLPITEAQKHALESGLSSIWKPLHPGNRFQANWEAVPQQLWPPMN
jgi:hypothetical protein